MFEGAIEELLDVVEHSGEQITWETDEDLCSFPYNPHWGAECASSENHQLKLEDIPRLIDCNWAQKNLEAPGHIFRCTVAQQMVQAVERRDRERCGL